MIKIFLRFLQGNLHNCAAFLAKFNNHRFTTFFMNIVFGKAKCCIEQLHCGNTQSNFAWRCCIVIMHEQMQHSAAP